MKCIGTDTNICAVSGLVWFKRIEENDKEPDHTVFGNIRALAKLA